MTPLASQAHAFVQDIVRRHFSRLPTAFLSSLFRQVDNLFAGACPGYQRCDTGYHDLRHTCDVAMLTARLMDGHCQGNHPPPLTARNMELAVAAALLHDTGYIKETGDAEGTGAKYTLVHVDRSIAVAGRILPQLGADEDEVATVQMIVRCTSDQVSMSALTFPGRTARYLGCAVATADILAQMAGPDYPERLRALFAEYREAVAFEGLQRQATGIASYRSAEDLMRRTRSFYETRVRHRLDEEWACVYRELDENDADGNCRNPFLDAIEANLDRIDEMLAGNIAGATSR